MMTAETLEGFPNMLRRLRIESGETQEQTAHAVGSTINSYRNWEKGRARPSLEYFLLLNEHFGGRLMGRYHSLGPFQLAERGAA